MPTKFFYGAAVVIVLVALIAATVVISQTPTATDLDLVKVRFAQVTFVGILVLFIFVSLIYAAAPSSSAGKEIFEKATTAMTPLVGVIIGYLFGKI
jgi:hypothetical protein